MNGPGVTAGPSTGHIPCPAARAAIAAGTAPAIIFINVRREIDMEFPPRGLARKVILVARPRDPR
jgi:predicted amidohydrolase